MALQQAKLPALTGGLLVLLLSPANLPGCHAQYGPDPPGTPPAFACAWRQLAAKYVCLLPFALLPFALLSCVRSHHPTMALTDSPPPAVRAGCNAYRYAHINRPDADAKVYDALQLGEYCNGTSRPVERELPAVFPPPVGSTLVPAASAVPPNAVYADAAHGSDSAGTGSVAKPLASLAAAVAAAAAGGPDELGRRTVVLRAGTFYLPAPVQVGVDGLTIQALPGEEVWLSGGTLLTSRSGSAAIRWQPHDLQGGRNIFKADLAAFGLAAIEGLRVDGTRVSPARYPVRAERQTERRESGPRIMARINSGGHSDLPIVPGSGPQTVPCLRPLGLRPHRTPTRSAPSGRPAT
eukprot:SAG22_NODE_237_length_14221_cov_37.207832_16_plen_351_part_00